ncbi:DUF4249 domain-containing protein [Coprobacter sp.]
MKTHLLSISLLLLSMGSCVNKLDYDNDGFENHLVIEGYIEEGDYPVVMLTKNKPFNIEASEETVNEIVVRWAKVIVSDGEKEEILVGHPAPGYFPPFLYKGNIIKGEAGKTYTLKVIYAQYELTAETTIPKTVPIKEITIAPSEKNDSLRQLTIHFDDPENQKNYYKIYTQVEGKNVRYVPALGGNLNDNLFNGQTVSCKISQGIEKLPAKNVHSDFYKDDIIYVKLCTLPAFGFEFWKDFENEIINGQNPFIPANKNLPTNIRGGGTGIWCGYGKYEMRILNEIKNRQ